MSKMIKITGCDICPNMLLDSTTVGISTCTLLLSEDIYEKQCVSDIKDTSKILPNCPLEDYPKTDGAPKSIKEMQFSTKYSASKLAIELSKEGKTDLCITCEKPRENKKNGYPVCPCPHCGCEIPF